MGENYFKAADVVAVSSLNVTKLMVNKEDIGTYEEHIQKQGDTINLDPPVGAMEEK